MQTFDVEEAASFLKTHPDTVRDCIASEGLPATKVGRAWVLVDEHIVAWLLSRYNEKAKECLSTSKPDPKTGGSSSVSINARYEKALAPRTKA